MIAYSEIDAFRARFYGAVQVPGDLAYHRARTTWNGELAGRPAVIMQCTGPADVSAGVRFARRHGLEVSVRGGFHNTAGTAICDDKLVIDLTVMREVRVDPVTRRARVGGGATLADLDAATQAHALVVPAGMVNHTWAGEPTRGGGRGRLPPHHGLSSDNLISAEVVTAEGRRLRASEHDRPDLLWALRSGGHVGVVTEFEIAVHPVAPIVQVGLPF